MAYRKPTEKELEYGFKEDELGELFDDISELPDDYRRGFTMACRSGMSIGDKACMEIQRISACYLDYPEPMPTDEDCAHEAERIGYCRIIPIDELPKNFKTEFGDDARWFGWVDTPENREVIRKWTEKCC